MNYAAPQNGSHPGPGDDSQAQSGWLDLASQDFLGYATDQAMKNGVTRGDGASGLRWIDFERVADPAVHTRAIAAQAFLHVLSLATKNAIAVRQEGRDQRIPFGTIHIGLSTEQASQE
jgi:hypothetical protein